MIDKTREADLAAPEMLWLNTAGDYSCAYEATLGSETGVTWCDVPQDDDDQKYIRADFLEASEARIAELEAERDRLRSALLRTVRQISKAMSPDIAVRLKDWREAMDEARAALRDGGADTHPTPDKDT